MIIKLPELDNRTALFTSLNATLSTEGRKVATFLHILYVNHLLDVSIRADVVIIPSYGRYRRWAVCRTSWPP